MSTRDARALIIAAAGGQRGHQCPRHGRWMGTFQPNQALADEIRKGTRIGPRFFMAADSSTAPVQRGPIPQSSQALTKHELPSTG